jgi:hypothetical protein
VPKIKEAHTLCLLYPQRLLTTLNPGPKPNLLPMLCFYITGKFPIIPNFKNSVAYRDTWLHDHRLYGFIDYAVFPVSLVLEHDGREDCAYVMYAYQNVQSFMSKFPLSALLKSMERVV